MNDAVPRPARNRGNAGNEPEDDMFSTLETTWDRSAWRGWSTLASFIFQGLALSLLFAIPLIWTQAPPLLRLADILTPRQRRRLCRCPGIERGLFRDRAT